MEPVKLKGILDEVGAHLPLLGKTLRELVKSLQLVIYNWDTAEQYTERPASNPFIRHRDWMEAGRAALRAACAIATAGIVWDVTRWAEGPLMLMAASIMVSIFSTHERPAELLNYIFCGAAVGVTAAFFCRLVLLPGASDPFQQMAISIPVLIAGIIALQHRQTSQGAMDVMMFFLFIMQPGLPAIATASTFVAGGFAALGGIGIAILAFRFLLPIDSSRRLRSLLIAIVTDLAAMTTTDSLLAMKKCRARMNHRVLRMFANAKTLNNDLSAIVEGGLAALAIGMQQLKEAGTKEGISHEASETIRDIKARLFAARKRPEEIMPVLEDASILLYVATEANIN